ncbi:DUF4352 domain-containing protein [Streptomyces sp. AB3(2024)]|uniref:DUF4352 domain-containing protein n=1 Tax=Streptomyces sp. AB3(2024) TaxID=3317321 RepID=UPI0035A387F3
MSTPPNPPDSPTEPEGTPIPPPGPSLAKAPAPATPGTTPAPEATEPPPEKAPATPEAPKPSLAKAPANPEAPEPSLEKTPATPEAAKPSLEKAAPAPTASAPAAAAPSPQPAPPRTPPPAAPTDPWATPVPGAPQPAPAPSAFAPVSPVPAAPSAPDAGAYGAPANAWAPPPPGGHPGYGGPAYGAPGYGGPGRPGFPGPGHPGYGHPGYGHGHGVTGYPVAPAAPSNGQAVAGLVLSALSIGVGLVPFVFWAGAGLALTGIGISIAGLVRAGRGAPRKVMSIVGIALGVLGLAATVGGFLFTTAIIGRSLDRVDQHRGTDWYDDPGYDPDASPDALPSPSGFTLPPDMPSTGPGISTPIAFGQTFTYPNGIKVSLSVPKQYVSSNKYLPVGNAVEVSFTITNTSKRPHDVIYAMPSLTDDKGAEGRLVFDGRLPKRIQGTIQPGESATGTAAFEVPEGTRSVSAGLSPGLLMPDAKFTGPVG